MSTPPWGEGDPFQKPGDQQPSGQPDQPGQPVPPPYQPYGTPNPYSGAYGGSPYGGPYQPAPPTNGLAVASMVTSIVGIAGLCCYGLGGIIGLVGAILGHVSKRRIRENNEGGAGMALAGIIVGWVAFGLMLAAIAFFVVVILIAENGANCSPGDPDYPFC
ncbi:DUF4190 domain-containing protein [Nocardioides sp. TF02-7]|uniref:DUF4190 domain-containing protein n=1 Tax=Nocardioides sp. TF02-7 TaxID=2917724 RepID=UPI001F05ED16|nr:DUF4190 domain-containing protein [Nocardioides sp. TF02-7]UMG92451.1 DUF4190 domain-containing protein [Nocardioides sp. TF02-7]